MDDNKILSLFSDPSSVKDFFIENINVTLLWIVKILSNNSIEFNKAIINETKICNFEIKQIGEGKGFISYVYRIILYLTNGEIFSFILKFPTSKILNDGVDIQNGEVEFISKEEVSHFHNNECLFYKLFNDIPNFKIPKVYYTQNYRINLHDGLLLLEDLTRVSNHIECYRSFNIYQIENIFDQIFILQSTSMSLKDKEWLGKLARPINNNDFPFFSQFALEHWKEFTKVLPHSLYKHLEEPLEALISHWKDIIIVNCYTFKEETSNEVVLAHGDMWNNNILFKIDSNGYPTNEVEALIDWQVLHITSTGHDLAKTLIYCTDPYIRKEAEEVLLKNFFYKLKGATSKNGTKFTMTFDLFIKNYKYAFIECTLMFLMNIKFSLKGCGMPTEDCDSVWYERKFNIGIRIIKSVADAVDYAKELKPEWLIKN
uniref:CHK domain-containing protein n=1 Tax=Strongyloides venezuelensis TaxID=75913 RepID=A0A0K0FDI4_STRVS